MFNEKMKLMDDVSKNIRKLQEETKGRDRTADEELRFNNLLDEYEKIQKEVEDLRKLNDLEEKRKAYAEPNGTPLAGNPGDEGRGKDADKELRAAAFDKFLHRGIGSLNQEERGLLVADDSQGGYLASPQTFVADVIKAVDDLLFIRQKATVFPLRNSGSLGVPSVDTDMSDADWTPEITSVTADTTLRLGKRELKPNLLTKLVKVSMKLLNSGAINIATFVKDRLAYKIALTQEKAFISGDGVNKPLGMFVASADGITTSRDVVSGSTSGVTADAIVNMAFALKEQYLNKSEWITSREVIKTIYKLKGTTTNDYIWQPGLMGAPATLMGRPYHMSENVPAIASGAYVAVLGDLSKYWIADVMDLAIQVVNELYAATNQVGYIGRMESDGMPVLAEAFARMKCATS